jgi:hypothetical protein
LHNAFYNLEQPTFITNDMIEKSSQKMFVVCRCGSWNSELRLLDNLGQGAVVFADVDATAGERNTQVGFCVRSAPTSRRRISGRIRQRHDERQVEDLAALLGVEGDAAPSTLESPNPVDSC